MRPFTFSSIRTAVLPLHVASVISPALPQDTLASETGRLCTFLFISFVILLLLLVVEEGELLDDPCLESGCTMGNPKGAFQPLVLYEGRIRHSAY